MNKKVLVSLHDVTPFHFERIRIAETYFAHWGIKDITYLFIPDYHYKLKNGRFDKKRLSEFRRDMLEKERPGLNIEWVLHGYFHLDRPAPAIFSSTAANDDTEPLETQRMATEHLSVGSRFKRKYLTANEGEFLSLTAETVKERLEIGKTAFRAFFNRDPKGFIAPAWLFNDHLIPELKRQKFYYTEDHSNIYLLKKDAAIQAPVITWATRTPLRKFISKVGCPILNRLWSGREYLRVAVHPFDFDHPSTIRSIDKVITSVLSQRQSIRYSDLPLI